MITKASAKDHHDQLGIQAEVSKDNIFPKFCNGLECNNRAHSLSSFSLDAKTRGFCIFRIVSLQGFFCNGNRGYVVCSLPSSWWRKNSHPHSVSLHHPWQFSNPFFLYKKTWSIQSLPHSPFDVRKFTYTFCLFAQSSRILQRFPPYKDMMNTTFWESSEKS
jgi:hypothetical protein